MTSTEEQILYATGINTNLHIVQAYITLPKICQYIWTIMSKTILALFKYRSWLPRQVSSA